jgi:hydroxyacylglutathione hydrolase
MRIDVIESAGLGNRGYVVSDGRTSVVVDPPRDIDRVEAVADRLGLTVGLVAETHRHADYVSGGLELARRHRADYLVPPGDPHPAFGFVPAEEGREVDLGGITLRALATPGHTPHHVAYVVGDATGPIGVCTGGSLLPGAVGRTDLCGAHRTRDLAVAQWQSARRLADELPTGTRLLPTHGFGSLCAAAGAGGNHEAGTIGDERDRNPALHAPVDQFVTDLIAGYGPIPRHYARLPLLNAAGPSPIDLSPPPALEAADLERFRRAGHWLVDVRDRRSFAACHLAGTVNAEPDGPFATYLPWLLPPGAGVVLLGPPDAVAAAARQLALVGIDRPLGVAAGEGPEQWAGGDAGRLREYAVASYAELAAAIDGGSVPLDVRAASEWQAGAVRAAQHLPLPELAARLDPSDAGAAHQVFGGPVWTYCGSGWRAAVAASLLSGAGVPVTLIDAPIESAADAGVMSATQAQRPD